MPFSDLAFIFIFLPIFLGIFYLVPQKYRQPVLLAGSIAFYVIGLLTSTAGRPIDFLALPLVMFFTWLASRVIFLYKDKRKTVLPISIGVLAGSLIIFKYFAQPIPPGMSFYVFCAISYIVDVSRGNIPARTFTQFGTYLACFPKLLSGPITRWEDMRRQKDRFTPAFSDIADGARMFIAGLAEKVILADTIGRLWQKISAIGVESVSTATAWLGAIAFSLQLYLDFQGYSVMACGIGKMIGLELPQNFNYPYLSRSVSEFWRRWHITLGQWFRDYIYIPLGGSRNGTPALVRNLFIVWLITGMWHGATLNFLLWGMMMFILIAAEKLFYGDFLKKHKAFSHIYLLIVIPISWMLFANTEFHTLAAYFGKMFSFTGGMVGITDIIGSFWISLLLGIIFCTPIPSRLFSKVSRSLPGTLVYAALLAASIYMIVMSGSGAFMYFSF